MLYKIELAGRQLNMPEVGEHIARMAALWDVATPEERRDMVLLLFEPDGFYYDLKQKVIDALQPRSAFAKLVRMLNGVVEYDEAKGLLVTERWQDRNRRATGLRSPLAFVPESILIPAEIDGVPVYMHEHIAEVQRRPGHSNP